MMLNSLNGRYMRIVLMN